MHKAAQLATLQCIQASFTAEGVWEGIEAGVGFVGKHYAYTLWMDSLLHALVKRVWGNIAIHIGLMDPPRLLQHRYSFQVFVQRAWVDKDPYPYENSVDN